MAPCEKKGVLLAPCPPTHYLSKPGGGGGGLWGGGVAFKDRAELPPPPRVSLKQHSPHKKGPKKVRPGRVHAIRPLSSTSLIYDGSDTLGCKQSSINEIANCKKKIVVQDAHAHRDILHFTRSPSTAISSVRRMRQDRASRTNNTRMMYVHFCAHKANKRGDIFGQRLPTSTNQCNTWAFVHQSRGTMKIKKYVCRSELLLTFSFGYFATRITRHAKQCWTKRAFTWRTEEEMAAKLGECLPGARPARYFSINYPDFSPRFTLPWRSPPSRPRCTAHLPYKARCIIKQYL